MSETSKDSTVRKIVGIQKSHEISEALLRNPNLVEAIVELYREGCTHAIIAEKLIPEELARSLSVARAAIGNVLEEAMDEDERIRLGKEHQQQSRIATGYRLLAGRKGIHAQTPEEKGDAARKGGKAARLAFAQLSEEEKESHLAKLRAAIQLAMDNLSDEAREIRRKNGRIQGLRCKIEGKGLFGISAERKAEIARKTALKLLEEGRGIHALTPEQRRAAVKKSLQRQGKALHPEGFKERLLELVEDPSFRRTKGSEKEYPDYERIRLQLKEEFGLDLKIATLRAEASRTRRKAKKTA